MSKVAEAIESLLQAIAERVAEEVLKAIPRPAPDYYEVSAPPMEQVPRKYNSRKPKTRLTNKKMRCQFRDGSGHRCKERSKGPRYSWRCQKHLGT
jgi:hypothetical protein